MYCECGAFWFGLGGFWVRFLLDCYLFALLLVYLPYFFVRLGLLAWFGLLPVCLFGVPLVLPFPGLRKYPLDAGHFTIGISSLGRAKRWPSALGLFGAMRRAELGVARPSRGSGKRALGCVDQGTPAWFGWVRSWKKNPNQATLLGLDWFGFGFSSSGSCRGCVRGKLIEEMPKEQPRF